MSQIKTFFFVHISTFIFVVVVAWVANSSKQIQKIDKNERLL